MKVTNALVTYTDLSTMGLVPKGTPATGNRIATKSFINSNYYVNQSASPYNTYTSLRCPPYQTIIAGPTNSGTMYYLSYSGGGAYTGFSSPALACAHTTGGSVTVYWNGTFGNGTTIYLDPDGITQLDGFNYYSLNGYSFGVDVSVVIDYAVCAVPSGVVFTPTSGLYPVSGTSSTCIGTLTNYSTTNSVYIKGLFNSAGVNSGTVGNNVVYYGSPAASVYFQSLTITSFGQSILTNVNSSNANPGWFILNPSTSVNITLDKFDGVGSGTTFRLAQSNASGGPYTAI